MKKDKEEGLVTRTYLYSPSGSSIGFYHWTRWRLCSRKQESSAQDSFSLVKGDQSTLSRAMFTVACLHLTFSYHPLPHSHPHHENLTRGALQSN